METVSRERLVCIVDCLGISIGRISFGDFCII